MDTNKDTLFDWMVRKAEADLGLAHAFAAGETERADQIKRLETTLVGQISDLQHQILESRELELNDLKSEVFACSDRMARIETAKAPSDAVKAFLQDHLGALRVQLNDRQSRLEDRHSGFQRLGDTLNAQIHALEKEIRDKLDGIRTAQGELHHLKSEAQSLTERVGQAESATWQTRTLAAQNAQQFEQTAESLNCEIAAIKTKLSEQERNVRPLDSLLKDIEQGVGAKIEEIQDGLAREYEAQLARDARLGQLDSGLATLAERVTKSEFQWRETHALAQSEAHSALNLRNEIASHLAALRDALGEAQVRESAIQENGAALRAKLEAWQHQTAQKFVLLESHDAEREASARELKESLGTRIAEQENRTGERLRAIESGQEELLHLKPEVQTLAERVFQAESAVQRAQAQADADTRDVGQLEDSLKNDIAALKAEFAAFNDHQRAYRLSDEQMREIEQKLSVTIDELQRQLAIEREGLGHWEKGLREAFSSELGAMQSRLSERQSQIEHRYARLDRLENTVTTSIHAFETQLKDKLQLQDHDHEQWRRIQSEIASLGERATELESHARSAQTASAASGQRVKESEAVLKEEINALKASLATLTAAPADEVLRGLEETLGAKLRQLEDQVAQKFSLYLNRDNERAQKSEQALNSLKDEWKVFKTSLDQQQHDFPSPGTFSQAIEETLCAKIQELDQKLAHKLSVFDSRDTERAQHAQTTIAALRSEIAELKSGVNNGAAAPAESAIHSVEASLAAKMQELQQQVAQKLILLDQRDVERSQEAQQVIAGFKTAMATLKADLSQQPAAIAPSDPALRSLEDQLSAKIHELSEQMAQKFSAFDSRDAELKELKDRSQSLIQRVAQLSVVIQAAQNNGPSAIKPMAVRPVDVAAQPPEANATGGNGPVKAQAISEKERLTKLQERMSAEIERVRAELKERSGRWKVRKSGS